MVSQQEISDLNINPKHTGRISVQHRPPLRFSCTTDRFVEPTHSANLSQREVTTVRRFQIGICHMRKHLDGEFALLLPTPERGILYRFMILVIAVPLISLMYIVELMMLFFLPPSLVQP